MAGSGKQWIELSVCSGTEAVDAVAEVFRANGASGVAVEAPVVAGPDEGFAESEDSPTIRAYLPIDAATDGRRRKIEESLWHLGAFDLAPMSQLSSRTVDEADWANAWKEHFHPFHVGRHLVIKPSWRELQASENDVVVDLDPGMAFGTGLHPTTQMMLEALEEEIDAGMRVFDVGTGSGILAIAAAKLGASKCLAVDTDPIACRVAVENVRLNHVESRVTVYEGSGPDESTPFDLILVNIVATVIAELIPGLQKLMIPTSILITSGIIEERADLVTGALETEKLDIVRTRQSGDWLCYTTRLAG